MIDAEDGSSFTEPFGDAGRPLGVRGPFRSASGGPGLRAPFRPASDDPPDPGVSPSPSLQRPWPFEERARLVLEIVPGERRREPAFGCRVHFLPQVETEEDRQIAAALIEESLELWLPGLGVERARVDSSEDGVIRLQLRRGGAWHALSIRHRRGVRRRVE